MVALGVTFGVYRSCYGSYMRYLFVKVLHELEQRNIIRWQLCTICLSVFTNESRQALESEVSDTHSMLLHL
jgi:hypothetical protein